MTFLLFYEFSEHIGTHTYNTYIFVDNLIYILIDKRVDITGYIWANSWSGFLCNDAMSCVELLKIKTIEFIDLRILKIILSLIVIAIVEIPVTRANGLKHYVGLT